MEDYGSAGTHYYGDITRRLFVAAGIIIITTLPFFSALIPFPITISAFGVLVIGFVAGMTSPRQSWVTILDALVAVTGLIIFEYYAVVAYHMTPATRTTNLFFWSNELLAVLFFFALYFSGKTLRGHVLNK
jgi:hypothetical protein